MSIAEKYLKEQMKSDEFRRSYLEEKTKLDIEYRLEELKKDIRTRKSPDELIERVEDLERFVMGV
jgi:polyhydroxyalkanoate synthesis regulator phasin